MEEMKGQTIFLSVIGIATLLIAIVGATFAWFSISVSGNENSEKIIYTTASLGSVVFNDGYTIDANGIIPGDVKTKTFTVSQTDIAATGKIKYNIILNVNSNTLTPNADGQFVHYLKGSGNINGGVLANLDETIVPESSTIIGSGILDGYEVHTYEYSISLKNLDIPQNNAQGKEFGGYITVELEQIKN